MIEYKQGDIATWLHVEPDGNGRFNVFGREVLVLRVQPDGILVDVPSWDEEMRIVKVDARELRVWRPRARKVKRNVVGCNL